MSKIEIKILLPQSGVFHLTENIFLLINIFQSGEKHLTEAVYQHNRTKHSIIRIEPNLIIWNTDDTDFQTQIVTD